MAAGQRGPELEEVGELAPSRLLADGVRGGRRGRNAAKHWERGVPIRSQSSTGARRDCRSARAESSTLNTVVGFPTAGDIAGVCGCGGAPAARIDVTPRGDA